MQGKLIQSFFPQLFVSWAAVSISSKSHRFSGLELIHRSVGVWGVAGVPVGKGEPMRRVGRWDLGASLLLLAGTNTQKLWFSPLLALVQQKHLGSVGTKEGGRSLLVAFLPKWGGNVARRLSCVKSVYGPVRGQKKIMLREANFKWIKGR